MPKIRYLHKTREGIPSIYPKKSGDVLQNMNFSRYYRNRGKLIYGFDPNIIINIVGIVPIIAPKDDIDKGLWKEVKKCDLKFRVATVSLHISFDDYIQSDIEKKKNLIMDNILKSVKVISKKGKFDFNHFKEDIICFCEMSGIKYL